MRLVTIPFAVCFRICSYIALIAMAIKSASDKKITLNGMSEK